MSPMTYSALSVANAFLARAKRDRLAISNMKLQKLLYLAHGHSYALRNEGLIDEEPEAWAYGPVYPSIYHEFKRYGSGPIKKPAVGHFGYFIDDEDEREPVPPPKGKDVNRFIEAVWNSYKDRSALYLSELSHVENGPWDKAWKRGVRGSTIRDADIAKYFKKSRAKALEKKAAREQKESTAT